MAKKKKDLISKVAEGAFKLGEKKGKKLGRIQTKKQTKTRSIKAQQKILPEQQKILSKEQTLLNNMFGGSVGRLVLLDRPGQFFDGSNFPVARPEDRSTAAMFGGRGNDTRKFFMPRLGGKRTI